MSDQDEAIAGVADIAAHGLVRYAVQRPHPIISGLVAAPDWPTFAASWAEMPRDTYMADGGRYRRRRYGVFDVAAEAITLKPPEPHYQAVANNRLNGGIERWFAPLHPAISGGRTLTALLEMCRATFGALSPAVRHWHAEVHQFRIEADGTTVGNPTPEGMHRDGVDFVLVLLVARANIARGTTRVADPAGRSLGEFTLERPGDAVLLDDRRVFHGVTPVHAVDPAQPAYRDVLVVTFVDAAVRITPTGRR
jgi:hypothetical protein